MAIAEVLDMNSFANTLPKLPNDLIHREHLINDIIDYFEYDTNVVILEGKENSGKTVVMTQLARHFYDNCVTIFINSNQHLSYDINLIRYDICSQIHWFLQKEELKNVEIVDEQYIKLKLYELIRYLRKTNKVMYFIIDGIDQLVDLNNSIIELIFEMFPIGYDFCRYIISSNIGKLTSKLNPIFKNSKIESFRLPSPSQDEIVIYLNRLDNITQEKAEEIYKICKGNFGNISYIKRSLLKGETSGNILDKLQSKYQDIYDAEWSNINLNDTLLRDLLALMAFDFKLNTVKFYSAVLKISEIEIQCKLNECVFIEINEINQVHFYPDSFQKYVKEKLSRYEQDAYDKLINYFINNSDNNEDDITLTTYYEKSGRLKELLNYLSPNLFMSLLNNTNSMYSVQQKADVALKASFSENIDDQIMRFSMSKSILKQMSQNNVWFSEIEARMQLDDEENALKLVHTTKILEDKLLMLTIIGKVKVEKGLTPSADVLSEIKKIYGELNFEEIGETSYLIASNLLYIYPDLAIDLIEKYAGELSDEKKENALDVAYTNLSLASLNSEPENQGNSEFTVKINDLSGKIKNPKLKAFSTAAIMLLRDFTVNDLLIELEKFESNTDKLFFIGHWAKKTKETNNVDKLLNYAMSLLNNKIEYAPNALLYLNISYMLKNITDIEKKKYYISMFDSQKGNIELLGPTEEFINLQLELAGNEYILSRELSFNRLIDIYFYISGRVVELDTRLDCLAVLYSKLHDIDIDRELEDKEEFFSLLKEEINKIVNIVIEYSSEHVHHLEKFIEEVSKININYVLEFITLINIEQQRNKAYGLLINSIISSEQFNVRKIREIIDLITDHDIVNRILSDFLEKISDKVEDGKDIEYQEYMSVFDIINRITEPEQLCLAYCDLIKILNCLERETSSYKKQLEIELLEKWANIDISWRRVDIGFKIVSKLSLVSIELARRVLSKIESLKEDLIFDDSNSSWTYINSLRLSIKSLSGLMYKKIDTEIDIANLHELIETIPSNGEKARLFSELAIAYYVSNRDTEGNELVRNKVKTYLEQISESDKRYYYFLVVHTSASLYKFHKSTAFTIIQTLPLYVRDIAYLRVCEFLLRKVSPYEPYEELNGQAFKLSYEDIIDLIDIIRKLEIDGLIYDLIKSIVLSISNRNYYNVFTRQQRSNIINELKKICEEKIPNQRFIKHEGYKLASLAYIWKCESGNLQEWKKLLDSARLVPNISDRALVISILIGRLTRKQISNQQDVILEFDSLVESIPTMLDKIQLYESFSNILLEVETTLSRKYIKKAMELTLERDNSEIYSAQKRIINFAHRLDPELANSLASLVDEDPARRHLKHKFTEHLDTLNLKKKMINDRAEEEIDLYKYTPEQFISASNKTLASLNAGRVETLSIEKIRDYLMFASDIDFNRAYSTYSWILTNNVKRFSNSNMANDYLRPMYLASISVSEVALKLTTKSRGDIKKIINNTSIQSNNNSILIRSNEKEEAILYIEQWISTIEDFLIICDPYFSLEDIEILKIINKIKPNISIDILTSIKEHKNVSKPWNETYLDYWRIYLSDQEPPDTTLYIVGTSSEGKLPLHDRWWLSNKNGLRFGSSFNSLGKNESEISILSDDDYQEKLQLVSRYLDRKVKEFQGEKIEYNMFTL